MNKLEGFNAEHKFTLSTNFPIVKLIQPVNYTESSSDKITFKWSEEKKASQYRIQVSTDIEFTNIVVDEVIKGELFTITEKLSENTYLWRVIAIDDLGNNGKPSEVRSFGVSENPYDVLLLLLYFLPALFI